MNQGLSKNDVLIEQKGSLGLITLNRPKALNSLSLEMIRQISAVLLRWEKDAGVKTVLFKGAGDRAFCAGGDLKIFHRSGMDYRRGRVPLVVPVQFFAEEYSLNRQLFHYPKPIVAFMNGITMGGGFGIAGNCKYRVVTEKTAFAMPETGIGFFPDVGSVYHLLRCPDNIGLYLALTGLPMGFGDTVYAGLAEHFIFAKREDELIYALQKESPETAIANLAENRPEASELKPQAEQINAIFGLPTMQRILAALEKDASPWAHATLALLYKRAPASVMVTAAHFEKSRGKSFDDVIRTDFILAQHFLQRMDLYEGIRAVLIERDNLPRWEPATFDEMRDADVLRYFRPTGYSLDKVEIFRAEG